VRANKYRKKNMCFFKKDKIITFLLKPFLKKTNLIRSIEFIFCLLPNFSERKSREFIIWQRLYIFIRIKISPPKQAGAKTFVKFRASTTIFWWIRVCNFFYFRKIIIYSINKRTPVKVAIWITTVKKFCSGKISTGQNISLGIDGNNSRFVDTTRTATTQSFIFN